MNQNELREKRLCNVREMPVYNVYLAIYIHLVRNTFLRCSKQYFASMYLTDARAVHFSSKFVSNTSLSLFFRFGLHSKLVINWNREFFFVCNSMRTRFSPSPLVFFQLLFSIFHPIFVSSRWVCVAMCHLYLFVRSLVRLFIRSRTENCTCIKSGHGYTFQWLIKLEHRKPDKL